MLTVDPTVLSTRELSQVEPIREYAPDCVLGEQPVALIASGAISGAVQGPGHRPVAITVRGKLECHLKALKGP